MVKLHVYYDSIIEQYECGESKMRKKNFANNERFTCMQLRREQCYIYIPLAQSTQLTT